MPQSNSTNCTSTFSFPPTARILSSADYQDVYGRGKRLYTKCFVVVIAPGAHSESRLGVTVSKKVHKRANKRNHIKRRVREWFRLHRHLFPEATDVAIIARKSAVDCSYTQVRKQLLGCLRYHEVIQPVKEKG